ncbi:hypothetical protein BD31_I1685 [Candidatus Nitrosopumilus salaria BD31]|uniref:Uncharacterized protein n=1 Tax=Candidatus Nitrosopumilus salarius BD31 TaxID=859350 RepID=I3D369_9ARCH|nr:hypothetical protein [Candidatus Nitrosopumilus salaria]EIJ66162.1 hypothetical protein BD31_I1685 [Candidatus Nitrosopumilus salaria BD31]
MNLLYLLGKRFSNGSRIKNLNYIELLSSGFVTKRDEKLLEKTLRNNAKKSLKNRTKVNDRR